MLYERWRNTAAARKDEFALREIASGRRWTFGELFTAGERQLAAGEIMYPQGQGADFILDLLAAWRTATTVCPLEPGQVPPHVPPPPVNCVHLKCTSATTGSARVVAFTAEQLAADADNIVPTMGLRPDWPNLGVISLAHSYGFANLVLPLLLHGIPLILVPAPLPEIVLRAADDEAALTLAAVPALWRAWHEAGSIPPNVRLAISAGAPLSLALEQAVFRTQNLKIHNFLGSSECGGIAYDVSEIVRTDATLAGSPMRNVNLSLNDAGCLVVRSAAVAETYWPEKSDSLSDGVFQTTDLATIRDGRVFLRGRLSDQINVAGRKLSPEVVEQALLAHPGVRDCVVFGVPTGETERNETVVAVVASDAPEAGLREFLLQRLPAWQVPREWQFVPALDGGARGKISRAQWRQHFAAPKNAS
jgi:long-chain acyl-CoA synthetase